MKTTVVYWLRDDGLYLIIVYKENASPVRYDELGTVTLPFHPLVLIGKSPIAAETLLAAFRALREGSAIAAGQAELWLPAEWFTRFSIALPNLPASELDDHIRWELAQELHNDLRHYQVFYRETEDGRIDACLFRIAAGEFWRRVTHDAGINILAIRRADAGDNLADIYSYAAGMEPVIGTSVQTDVSSPKRIAAAPQIAIEVSPRKEEPVALQKRADVSPPKSAPVIKQKPEEVSLLKPEPLTPKKRVDVSLPVAVTPSPKRFPARFLIVSAIALIVGGIAALLIISNFKSARKHTPTSTMKLVPAAIAPPSAVPESLLQKSVIPTASQAAGAAPVALFRNWLERAAAVGELEMASISPSEIVLQLQQTAAQYEAAKSAWLVGSATGAAFFDQASRCSIFHLPVQTFVPDTTFRYSSVASGEAVSEVWDSVLVKLRTAHSLPYRLTILRQGNRYRVAIVR